MCNLRIAFLYIYNIQKRHLTKKNRIKILPICGKPLTLHSFCNISPNKTEKRLRFYQHNV